MLERSIIDDGEYPDKKYVNQLLEDISTRLAIFDYEKVKPDTKLDLAKMNKDFYCIRKDLGILYEIIDELAGKKYRELEAYVNGYLLTLETIADKADKKAREDIEATALGAKNIFFKDSMPSVSFDHGIATMSLGNFECTAGSKIYATIKGYGFLQTQVAFLLNDRQLLPYNINRDTVTFGDSVKKNSYTYSVPKTVVVQSAFKIANTSIKVDKSHRYEAYGGMNQLQKATANRVSLLSFKNGVSYETASTTQYSFYLTNATQIRFEFTQEPQKKNFYDDEILGLRRDKMYHYEFTLGKDAQFNIETNGIVYATKEKLSINDKELYVSGYTQARDFLINEYEPAGKVSIRDAKIKIYDVEEDAFRIDAIAIKEIPETAEVEES